MSPYFYKLSHSLISDILKEKIIKLSNEQLGEFVSYTGQRTGKADGNHFYFGKLLNEDPEIISLISSCTLRCFPIIILHYPNTKVLRHIDNPNKRNCVLLTPVFPTVNYTPTWFWNPTGPFEEWEEEEMTPAATCEFENMNSVVLNTQQPHSLQTTDSFRMNFQLCFEDRFETVVSCVQNNTLFKN